MTLSITPDIITHNSNLSNIVTTTNNITSSTQSILKQQEIAKPREQTKQARENPIIQRFQAYNDKIYLFRKMDSTAITEQMRVDCQTQCTPEEILAGYEFIELIRSIFVEAIQEAAGEETKGDKKSF